MEVSMKERIHEQISGELKQATRLDIKIVIIDIVISLILFFIAMGFAASAVGSLTGSLTGELVPGLGVTPKVNFNTTPTIVMFVLLLAVFAINWYSVRALLNNKKQRAKLTEGLIKLYKDEGVEQYYDGSIFKSYEARYNLFAVILTIVGAVSIIAPLVIFIDRLTKL
jgi:amino acid transporter